MTLAGENKTEVQTRLLALEDAGHPVVRIHLSEQYALGQEMFHWEMAVAAAGAVLGIHPFNQPDVELAKKLAQEAMRQESKGTGKYKGEAVNEVTIRQQKTLQHAVSGWLDTTQPGDYVAMHAYLAPTPKTTRTLQAIRHQLRDRLKLATTLGYGPRFLHSTGQLHKGGPNTGLFLQLVDEPANDLSVPETNYTFRALIHAQAVGDYQALTQRGRRVLRVNLGEDVIDGLQRLAEVLYG